MRSRLLMLSDQMHAGVLVLSGFNLRAVVALCRRAAEARIPVHLVARNAEDPIYLTTYAAQVFTERTSARLDVRTVVAWIQNLRAQHHYARVLLAPSTEFFNRFLLKNRAALEAAGGVVPLVSEELYTQLSDKDAFGRLCAAHGIPVPKTLADPSDRFPFVAKPKTYGAAKSGQIKPYLIHSAGDLQRFRARENADRFFFQEFIPGQSLYLLAHIARNGSVLAGAQENLIQQPHGGSIVLARPHDFHRHAAAREYLTLLAEVGFHGLVMIEVRRCARSGRHYMIEANPRLWGPLQFTLDQGLDLLGDWLADYAFPILSRPNTSPLHDYYFWSGGLGRSPEPDTFHNYSAERFQEEHREIAPADLFHRPDTLPLHEHEMAEACVP